MSNLFKQYLLHFSYDGSKFSGVVKSKNSTSISSVLNDAFLTFLPTIKPYSLYVSSRTDKGVHAFENTFKFCTSSPHTFNVSELRWAMNHRFNYLKEPVRIHQIKEIGNEVNIMSIIESRTYLYRIGVTDQTNLALDCITPWDNSHIFFIEKPFYMNKFEEIAALLSGQKDYSGFTNLEGTLTTRSTVKTLKINIKKSEPSILNMHHHPNIQSHCGIEYYNIFISAESFMNKMVRYLMGCMVEVAQGKLSIDSVKDICDRGEYYLQDKPFICAPAHALYLYQIKHKNQKYDFDINQWKEEMNHVPDECNGWNRPVEIINSSGDIKEEIIVQSGV